MTRLDAIFARSSIERRLIIPYICAGDPDLETSLELIRALGRAGAEIVELGIPFSDPVGDGATITNAARRALKSGTNVACTLELCGSVGETPAIVLLGYLNPIAQYGIDRFAADAADAGVCGVIVADLPYEDAELLAMPLRRRGVALSLLVAPTTPVERAARIAQASDAFIYVVSRLGVTGAKREPNIDRLAERLSALRAQTALPLAAGFGLSTVDHVRCLVPHTNAIVTGSALIDTIAGRKGSDAANAASVFLRPLVEAARLGFAAVN